MAYIIRDCLHQHIIFLVSYIILLIPDFMDDTSHLMLRYLYLIGNVFFLSVNNKKLK